MATISKPNTFSDDTPAEPSEINANFDTIYDEFNGGISAENVVPNSIDSLAPETVGEDELQDDSVIPKKLNSAATATTWAWQSWTPAAFGNMSAGAVYSGAYTIIGKTLFYRLSAVMASGSAPTGSVTFTLPIASVSYPGTAGTTVIGNAVYVDGGSTTYVGTANWSSTTTATLHVNNAAGTYSVRTALSSSIPMTWANTDEIIVTGFYEIA